MVDLSDKFLPGEGRAGGVDDELEALLRVWLLSRASGSNGEGSSTGVCVRPRDEAERVARAGLIEEEDASGGLWGLVYGAYAFCCCCCCCCWSMK